METKTPPRVVLPARMVPSFNVKEAFDRGVERKFLINTWGGLGDQVCAEPAIRYALKAFPKCEISLATRQPDLFTHLNFKEVFDTRKVNPVHDHYMVFQSIVTPDHLLWEFISHMISHCVDFPSICMFRCQLPNADKEIQLPDYPVENPLVGQVLELGKKALIIHAGKHWPSKTFPKDYWDEQVRAFQREGFQTVLIGKEGFEVGSGNVGFVDVSPEGSIDLRNQLSMRDLVCLLKNSHYLFSNDSAPIHIAAAGDAFIGFVASCKHPDYITHWRKGQFGYKTKNFGLDGAWNHFDHSPVQDQEVKAEELPVGLMEKILPAPHEVASLYRKLREEK
jgi:hypothetical protein